MVLQNYVMLQQGVPARLHFSDHNIQVRTITDPTTRMAKNVNTLVFNVDRLNGAPVESLFSTVSEKLAGQFAAYLSDKSYKNYEFLITQIGTCFQTAYTVQSIPLVTGA